MAPARRGKQQRLKESFRAFDANGNGKLQFDEFLQLLRRGRPDFAEDEADGLFRAVDTDLSGEIDFFEFVDYLYDNKSFEELITAKPGDFTEAEAKAMVLNKSLRLRAAASTSVKTRGQAWSQLTWKERLEEIQVHDTCAPGRSSATPPPLWLQPAPAAKPSGLVSVATVSAPEKPVAQNIQTTLPVDLGAAALNLRRSSGAHQTAAAKENSFTISSMSQSQLVDYSLMDEDLAWAGQDSEVKAQMTEFKDHLRRAGDPFDNVEVSTYLAKGTAGWVFLAKRKQSGVQVAMKLIRMTQARTGIKEWYVSKLMRKVGVANIVFTDETPYVLERRAAPPVIEEQLENAGPVPYYVCFIQEFMNGGSLEGLVKDGRLTPEMMFQALHEVASTLAAMHAQGVQHRDVKPENVLVSMEGGLIATAKLCDFGSAELGDSSKGRADDVRRFGVTLFSLATGEGWTKNRLIHESHDALVERMTSAVMDTEEPALKSLPIVLEKILAGGLEMEQVVPLLGSLRSAVGSTALDAWRG